MNMFLKTKNASKDAVRQASPYSPPHFIYSDPDNPFGAKSKRKRLLADRIWIFGPKPFSGTLYMALLLFSIAAMAAPKPKGPSPEACNGDPLCIGVYYGIKGNCKSLNGHEASFCHEIIFANQGNKCTEHLPESNEYTTGSGEKIAVNLYQLCLAHKLQKNTPPCSPQTQTRTLVASIFKQITEYCEAMEYGSTLSASTKKEKRATCEEHYTDSSLKGLCIARLVATKEQKLKQNKKQQEHRVHSTLKDKNP